MVTETDRLKMVLGTKNLLEFNKHFVELGLNVARYSITA